jgi:DUF4097 and DUF4098 domain-containing protein YvlB
MQATRLCTYIFALVALPLALGACVSGVNGSVDVPAGTSKADASTVNGAVNIGPKAKVDHATTVNGSVNLGEGAQAGEATTVNGHVTLAANATAGKITTVNGGVTLDGGASVSGDVTAVNGALSLAAGSAVHGSLTNVNSHITIDGAHVGHGITTVNGDIDITGKAVVDGGIKVAKPNDHGLLGIHISTNDVPRITIGPGATVNGPLTFERPVQLYISNAAQVAGPITGATAVKFSGPTPPAS